MPRFLLRPPRLLPCFNVYLQLLDSAQVQSFREFLLLPSFLTILWFCNVGRLGTIASSNPWVAALLKFGITLGRHPGIPDLLHKLELVASVTNFCLHLESLL